MTRSTEFKTDHPLPWRGFTSIEANEFLRANVPGEPCWTYWTPDHHFLKRLLVIGKPEEGAAGAWRWKRAPCPYASVSYHTESLPPEHASMWTGLAEVTAPDGRRFLLFSFLSASGEVGRNYMVSTSDTALLAGFSDALRREFSPADRITISAPYSEAICIDGDDELLCLPKAFREDIERQAVGFFTNEALYRELGIPHRRGLLFVGPPGCGKTLMIRNLIRQIHRRASVDCWALGTSSAAFGAETLNSLFTRARQSDRVVIIIEDIERVAATDSPLRPALLGQMDGLASSTGLLVLATTNYPENLDPAISKRPSRFDRTWVFGLPDESLRREYLRATLGFLGEELVGTATRRTAGWSFAFLNELRITAAVLAMDRHVAVTADHVAEAMETLTRQMKTAKDGFKADGQGEPMGFGAPS